MSNQELNNYIYAQSQRGMNAEEIRKILVQNGWGAEDINAAFAIVRPKEAVVATTATAPAAAMPTEATKKPVVEQPQHAAVKPMEKVAFRAAATSVAQQPQEHAQTPGATVFGSAPLLNRPQQIQPVDMFEQVNPLPQSTVLPQTQQPFGATAKPQVVIKEGLSLKAKIGTFSVIGLVMLAVIAGGAYAYYRFYTSPSRIGKIMMQNMEQLQSFKYSVTVTPEFATPQSLQVAFGSDVTKMQLTGTGVVHIPNDAAATGDMQASIVLTKKDASEKTLGFDARYVQNAFFLLLAKPDQWPLVDLTSAAGKWIKLAVSDAKTQSATQTQELNFTVDEKVQLRSALFNPAVIDFDTSASGNEAIHGVETKRYGFIVRNDGLQVFAQTLATILLNHKICTQAQCEAVKKLFVQNEQIVGNVWIGKSDYQMYQVQLNVPQQGTLKHLDVVFTLWDHGSAPTVAVPSPTVNVMDVISEGLSGLLDGFTMPLNSNTPANTNIPRNTNTSSIVDSDTDGLTDQEEVNVYQTDPKKPDTDGDGYTDGEEVDHGYNPKGPGTLEK